MPTVPLLPFLLSLLCAAAHAKPHFVSEHRAEIEKAKILFIGEQHDDRSAKDKLPSVLNALRRVVPDLNCVALEIHSDLSRFPESLQRGDLDVDEATDRYIAEVYALQKRTEAFPGWVRPAIHQWFRLLPKLSRRFRFFAVDLPAVTEYAPEFDMRQEQEARNAFMSARLLGLIRDGTCSRVVSINGQYHLFNYTEAKTIPDRVAPYYDTFSFVITSEQRAWISQKKDQLLPVYLWITTAR